MTVKERALEGRAQRAIAPRSSHAVVHRAPQTDPLAIIAAQEVGRIQALLPVRHERMAAGPFPFYRVGAALMAADLAAGPSSGVMVQACGDAHISNLGFYGSPERSLVFDINDFDETLRAPFEWDLKRLAASIAIAAQHRNASEAEQVAAVRSALYTYQDAMAAYATSSVLDVWYAQISAEFVIAELESAGHKAAAKTFRKGAAKARLKTGARALGRGAVSTAEGMRILDNPPFLVPIDSPHFMGDRTVIRAAANAVFETYVDSTRPATAALLRRFTPVDIAIKVVGVGSVGTRCFILLLEGNGPEDALFLQIKEAGPSVLEQYVGASPYGHHGERVVVGQQIMQASSDILLGHTTGPEGRHFYVRQLRDMKASIDVDLLDGEHLAHFAKLCAVTVARAHARGGDPARVAGYMGRSRIFADALAEYALGYAQVNTSDYQAFMSAREPGTALGR